MFNRYRLAASGRWNTGLAMVFNRIQLNGIWQSIFRNSLHGGWSRFLRTNNEKDAGFCFIHKVKRVWIFYYFNKWRQYVRQMSHGGDGGKWFIPHRFWGKAVLSGWATIPQNEWHVVRVLFENHRHFASYCSDRGWPAELSIAVDLGTGDRTVVGAWSWQGVNMRAQRNLLLINHFESVLIGGGRLLTNHKD